MPTKASYLFADAEGHYPVALKALESKALTLELARPASWPGTATRHGQYPQRCVSRTNAAMASGQWYRLTS